MEADEGEHQALQILQEKFFLEVQKLIMFFLGVHKLNMI